MKVGFIGMGARCTAYINRMLKNPEFKEHKVAAFCDINEERLNAMADFYAPQIGKKPATYTDWKELLADESIEGIVISTPDFAHTEIAVAAIEAGKHILLEKPIEVTPERAKAIYDAGKDYDKTLVLGFVLRYTSFYGKIKEMIDNGELGDIVSVTASENLDKNHSSSYLRRWHRYSKYSGGMMNTKCCHDIDILNFLIGSRIKTLTAFGSNSFYVPKEGAAEHCCDCQFKDECIYSFDYTNYGSATRWDCQKDICVYNCEKDVLDRHTMMLEYENGILATFELVMFSGEETRLIRINGTKATLEASLRTMKIKVTPLDKTQPVVETTLPPAASFHGGGDDGLLRRFFASAAGKGNINNIEAGYLATMAALYADISARQKRIIAFNEVV